MTHIDITRRLRWAAAECRERIANNAAFLTDDKHANLFDEAVEEIRKLRSASKDSDHA